MYSLPEITTAESLEISNNSATFLTFGNKILMAGFFYNGRYQKNYFAAVYTFTTDDQSCEGEIMLTAESNKFFADNGHAIEWAMTNR